MSAFELEFKKLFGRRQKMKSNLPKFLENLLTDLRGMKQIIFASADKNLGPVAVTLEQYIKDAPTHLSDDSTYKMLSSDEAEARDKELRVAISEWISKYVIDLLRHRHEALPEEEAKSHQGRPFRIFLHPL